MILGFILPNAECSRRIRHVQAEIDVLRQDQRERVTHLLSSWKMNRAGYATETINIIRRAIRNTKINCP